MRYSDRFQTFVRGDAIGGEPHAAEKELQIESLRVAAAYAAHLKGLKNNHGRLLDIECGFVRDYGLNGAAGVEAGRHFCVLDVNLVGAMTDLAMTALSVAEVLPEIGQAKAEQTVRVEKRDWPMGYALVNAPGIDDREPAERLTLPLDVTRRRCGVYLQQVALDLLWRHEIAHALLGHVDFVQDRFNLRTLNERPAIGQMFDVLPLEVEADKHALLSCLDTASQGAAPFQRSGLSLTVNQRYRCTVLAASLVLWFWAYLEGADRRADPGYDSGESHPPPGLRIMQLLAGLWEYFVRIARNGAGLNYVISGVHDDLLAVSRAHRRFAILDPETLYAPARKDKAVAAHKIVAERRDAQAGELDSYRYLER